MDGDDDDPLCEHQKWFPNCVYVRFVMDGNEPRPAFAAAGVLAMCRDIGAL